jgi:hypothetical protein
MKKYTAKSLHPDASELNHEAYKRGCSRFRDGSFHKAKLAFEEALGYWPKDSQAWMALGNCEKTRTAVLSDLTWQTACLTRSGIAKQSNCTSRFLKRARCTRLRREIYRSPGAVCGRAQMKLNKRPECAAFGCQNAAERRR